VDGTGSGSCPVAGFGISGVEPSGSVTRWLLFQLPFGQIHNQDRNSKRVHPEYEPGC
jgi:hypothetical protein